MANCLTFQLNHIKKLGSANVELLSGSPRALLPDLVLMVNVQVPLSYH